MVNNRLTLNCPNVIDYINKLENGTLPLFAYSDVKDYPLAKFARRLYSGELSRTEVESLSEQDHKITGYIRLLQLLGLMKRRGDKMVLTDKAMSYGSHATKKIAMATLSEMNNILMQAPPINDVNNVVLDQTMIY